MGKYCMGAEEDLHSRVNMHPIISLGLDSVLPQAKLTLPHVLVSGWLVLVVFVRVGTCRRNLKPLVVLLHGITIYHGDVCG